MYKYELSIICYICKEKGCVWLLVVLSPQKSLGSQTANTQITNPQITKKTGSAKSKFAKCHIGRRSVNLSNYLNPKIFGFTICGLPSFAFITFLINLYLHGARYRLTSGWSLATVTSSFASVRLASVKWLNSMDKITIKTPCPKCRLYWCLIEFKDWRNNQSCWYFRPFLWTSAPLTFSLVHLCE